MSSAVNVCMKIGLIYLFAAQDAAFFLLQERAATPVLYCHLLDRKTDGRQLHKKQRGFYRRAARNKHSCEKWSWSQRPSEVLETFKQTLQTIQRVQMRSAQSSLLLQDVLWPKVKQMSKQTEKSLCQFDFYYILFFFFTHFTYSSSVLYQKKSCLTSLNKKLTAPGLTHWYRYRLGNNITVLWYFIIIITFVNLKENSVFV